MFKKAFSVSIVLFGIVFSAAAGEYFAGEYFANPADALVQLEQAEAAFKELIASFAQFEQAETYEKDVNYKQAEEVYKKVTADYPGTNYALQARKKLTMLYISWDKPAETDAAFGELITDFSKHPLIPGTVYRIAEHATRLDKHERAKQLYQYVVDNWPGYYYEMWAQLGVAVSNISLGDDPNSQTAVDRLLADFYDNARISDAVYDVAHRYNRFGKYEKARQYYQYVLDNWPESKFADWAKIGLAQANIGLGDYVTAEATVDKLVGRLNTDFASSSVLPAVAVEGYYYAGDCYRKLDKYKKSIQCYERIVDNCPQPYMCWSALFMVGYNYEEMKKSGLISASEADPKIRAAYEQVVEKYPDCPAAKHARWWLSRHPAVK